MLKTNIIGLTWIQLANYAAPIVALPLLTRTLGLHDFGLYIFYSGISNFIAILADMGVGNIATQRIVLANSKVEKDSYYISIMGIKCFFLLVSIICLFFATKFFFDEQFNSKLFVFAAASGASLALTPSFYYLANGDSVRLAAILSAGKLLFLLALAILAMLGLSLYTAMLVTCIPALCATFSANLIVILKIAKLKNHFSFDKTKQFFKESRVFALSNLMVWTYTSSPSILIAKFHGTESAALYGASEKVIVALKSLISPIQQGAHPWVLSALKDNPERYKKRALCIFLFLIGFGLVTMTLLYFSAEKVLYILGKEKLAAAYSILVAMAVLPLLTSMTGFMGNFVLIPLGMNRVYLTAIAAGFSAYILSYFVLIRHGVMGTVFSMITAELVIVIVMSAAIFFRLRRKSIVFETK
jgi:PST family polysaccharide transporter